MMRLFSRPKLNRRWMLAAGVRGIKGRVDLNVFNGTREQFEDFVSEYRVKHTYKICEVDTIFDGKKQ